jgi:PKD repeat protein
MKVTVIDNVSRQPVQGAIVEYTGEVYDLDTTDVNGLCQFVRAFGRQLDLTFMAKKRNTYFDSNTVEVNVPPDVNIVLELHRPPYSFTTIGDVNLALNGLDIDDTGNFIVGNADMDIDDILGYEKQPAYWENGVLHLMYSGKGMHNRSTSTNNAGQATGQIWIDSGTPWPIYHPFLWDNGSFTDLLEGQNNESRFADGINNLCQIVGDNYLWDNGTWTQIIDDEYAHCYAINDLTQVVGVTGGSGWAFLWENGSTNILPVPSGARDSEVWDISNIGWIAGSIMGVDYYEKAYRWKTTGEFIELGGLPGKTSHYARAVNNCGQIVGNSITSTLSGGNAWLWENGGPPKDLNKLVLPNIGWHISYPTAINDKGQILGHVSDGWNWAIFLLTPDPPQCNVTFAYKPSPKDNETGARINKTLTWMSGSGAEEHDVYFGTNPTAVADANHSSPEFKGTVSSPSYNPGTLLYNTWYYWRVDEIGAACSRKGEVWSFMTGGTTPAADFTGSPTNGISPLVVNFTDTSKGGSITAWSWNFGDSGSSTLENPTHAYTSAGTFTVSLTATGPGGSNTKTKTNYITVVPAAPVANFFGSPTSGPAPLTVNFTDKSTGTINSWSWDFGDSGTSTTQNPAHQFSSNGAYTVTLTVSNAGGSDTETKTAYINVASPPVAAFSGSPTSGVAPLNVSFTDSSTGTITARNWDFGDGATSTAQNPSHSYSAGGAYTVTLVVTGPGGMDTESKPAYIQIWTTYNNSNTGGAIGNNNINAVGIESGGIRWFGTNGGGLAKYDGTTWTKYTTAQGLAGNTVNHIAFDSSANKWVATGTGVSKYNGSSWTKYTAGNSSLAGNNCYSIAAQGSVIWVGTYDKGACKFDGSSWQTYNTTNSGIAGVRINDIAIDTSGNKWFATMNGISKYDGTTWTTYASQLPSDDVYGAVIAPNGDKWFATLSGVSRFTGSSWTTYTQSQGLAKNDNRSIDVAPDGTVWAGSNGSGASKFTGSTPWIVYSTSNSGLVNNTVNAVGTEGNTLVWFGTNSGVSKYDSTPQSPPAAPNAQFTGSPTSGNFPLTVNFTDQSTGSILIRSWSFGDGDTSLTQNPSHAYQYAGVYSVSLTVTGSGGSDTETKTGYITATTPPAPNAAFTGSPTSGLIPLAVNFTNQSTGNITSYNWSFGDGATSTTQSPSHIYSTAGTYTVTLVAAGPGGNDVEMKNNYITATVPQPPVAAFTGSPTSGTRPLTVNFTDQSTGTISSWLWDFGDSGSSNAQNPSHIYTSDGTYTVILTVSGLGGNDSETKVNYISVSTPPPPVADFSGSPTNGYYPLTVNFTDLSTGQINTWSWTFGDGGTSTLTSPSHIYQSLGVFTVSLTVTGYGGSDTETKVNYITTSTPTLPNADFTASQTTGYAPLTVNFTDQSTGIVTAWSWTFGDGGTSTAQNPSHIYNDAGTYTVSLTASNGGGSDNETKTNYITVYPPPSGFSDNFNRADSTTLGNGWTEVQGDLKILSNEVRNEAIKIYHMAIQSSLSGTYQDVACDFARTTLNGGPRFGVMLRYQDVNNYYYFWRQTGGTSRLYISKVVNGTKTDLVNTSISGPGANALFNLEGIADGTSLKLKLNGVEKLSITDSTFSSGSCGIQFGSTSNTDSHRADNFTATIGSL